VGLAPPLAIAALIFVLGAVIMLVRALRHPEFFRRPRELANRAQSPVPMGRDAPIAPGGVLIDCNASADEVLERVQAGADGIAGASPVSMVFGVQPSGLSGEEYDAVRDALIEDGHAVFTRVEHDLRGRGVRNPVRLFEEADAAGSVEAATEFAQPSVVI
jgi:hypothetical protein